jgi:hypothetical protein
MAGYHCEFEDVFAKSEFDFGEIYYNPAWD